MENIIDLIYAYSLGCLDHEEQQKVSEYIDSKEESNLPILGDFQNLIALLPTTLPIEIPDPLLKDIVAKRLYRLNEEKKAEIQKNITSLNTQEEIKEETNSLESAGIDEETELNKDQNITDDFMNREPTFYNTPEDHQIKEDNSNRDSEYAPTEEENIPREIINDYPFKEPEKSDLIEFPTDPYKKVENHTRVTPSKKKELLKTKTTFLTAPDVPEKKKSGMMIWVVILTYLLIIGVIALYFVMSFKTNNLYSEVEKLKNRVTNLNSRIGNGQEVQEMLQSPDVEVINLKGTDNNPNGYGRLFIRYEKGLGYIQFAQMPSPPIDKSYQLWAKVPRKVISLGIFQFSADRELYPFNIQILPKADIINFFITEEPKTGSFEPGNKVYLIGKSSN